MDVTLIVAMTPCTVESPSEKFLHIHFLLLKTANGNFPTPMRCFGYFLSHCW
jgi:hypothetical protein